MIYSQMASNPPVAQSIRVQFHRQLADYIAVQLARLGRIPTVTPRSLVALTACTRLPCFNLFFRVLTIGTFAHVTNFTL